MHWLSGDNIFWKVSSTFEQTITVFSTSFNKKHFPKNNKNELKKIAAFDMEILHKKGKDNVVTNALSRKDEEPTLLAVSVVVPKWLNEI